MSSKQSSSSLLIDVGEGLSLMLGFPSINTWTTSERPNEAKKGSVGFNSQTSSLEYYDGESWYSAKMSRT